MDRERAETFLRSDTALQKQGIRHLYIRGHGPRQLFVMRVARVVAVTG